MKPNGSKQLNVPLWLISVFKFTGPVVVAVAIGYARFVGVEKTVEQQSKGISETNVKAEAQKELVSQLTMRQSTMELKQSVLEKSIGESLIRIESSVKDVQVDVKDLQKRVKP